MFATILLMAGDVKGTRTYHSPLRAEQADKTRQRVLAAARELFLARGYAGTKVRDVADLAGVSPDTVYVSLGGKKGLLEGVWALAATVPPDAEGREQEELVAAIAAGPDPRERLGQLVTLSCETLGRVSPVHAVLRAAADGHPFAADLQAKMLRSRLDTQAENLRTVLGDATLQPNVTPEDAAEHYSALLSPELYHLLTVTRGWPIDSFRNWVWAAMCREFLE